MLYAWRRLRPAARRLAFLSALLCTACSNPSTEIGADAGDPRTDAAEDEQEPSTDAAASSADRRILENMIEMMAYQERVDIVQATALLICRIDEKWSVEQSMDLHPDLIKQLSLLYVEEDKRSTEALEAAVAQDGGAEGK